MQIILCNLGIVVITPISIWVDVCNNTRGIGEDGRNAPGIVGVSCNGFCILINNSNYITLKILDEIVGKVVVEDTANAVLVIVERNEGVFVPSLAENLSAVKRISVKNTVDLFAGSDAVCIVGVGIAVKGRKLSAPIIPFSLLSVKKNSSLKVYFEARSVERIDL